MLSIKRWVVVATAAYLAFLTFTLPAHLLTGTLNKRGIQVGNIDGTLWQGQATQVSAGVMRLGSVRWQVRPLWLLTGRAVADVELTLDNGQARARVLMSVSGAITLRDVNAVLPMQSLVGSSGLPGGWVGTLQARFDSLVLKDRWPVSAVGVLKVMDVQGPANSPQAIGNYRISFDRNTATDNVVVGKVADAEGAKLGVKGTLTLKPDRSYQLDVDLGARADTPPALAQMLQYLGSPNAQGQRPFSVSGVL